MNWSMEGRYCIQALAIAVLLTGVLASGCTGIPRTLDAEKTPEGAVILRGFAPSRETTSSSRYSLTHAKGVLAND